MMLSGLWHFASGSADADAVVHAEDAADHDDLVGGDPDPDAKWPFPTPGQRDEWLAGQAQVGDHNETN